MENKIRFVVGILTTTGCKSIRYIDKFWCFWMFLTRIEFLQSSYAGDEWIIAYPTSQKPFMSRSNPKFWQENHWNLISNMNWCTCLNPKYASPFLHVGNISNHFLANKCSSLLMRQESMHWRNLWKNAGNKTN